MYEKIILCANGVASKHFHISQNENSVNCKNSHRMKFSVLVKRRGLCWFSVDYNGWQSAICRAKILND